MDVVVASFRDQKHLSNCLASLTRQSIASRLHVIVARSADCGDVDQLRADWPSVRWVSVPARLVPPLRGAGLAIATAPLILLSEDHCVADPRWAETLCEALRDVDVAGGSMDNAQTARQREWGAFFAEYGFFDRSRRAAVPDALLTGANVGYRATVAARVARWMQAGDWENTVHARLTTDGTRMGFFPGAIVLQTLQYGLRSFCRDRYQHGRDYARARVANERLTWPERLARAGMTPALAPLLLLRLERIVHEDGPRRRTFLRALPWTLLFLSAWSVGECVGYLTASSTRERRA